MSHQFWFSFARFLLSNFMETVRRILSVSLDLKKILMTGKAISLLGVNKKLGDIRFYGFVSRGICYRQKIEHEFSHNKSSANILGLDVGGNRVQRNLIGVAVAIPKLFHERPQIKTLPQEVVKHSHAIGLRIL